MILDSATYLRSRTAPEPGDELYLHLHDLQEALSRFASSDSFRILDFGCGGSPYRDLFPNATYLRADIPGIDGLDYEIDEDSRISETSSSFDFVISTQVLEHVRNPAAYFAEALRLLKPGGALLATTHGIFPEHGSPEDYRRWTADGLAQEAETAGFETQEVYKLTLGGRALAFLLDIRGKELCGPRSTFFGAMLWFFHGLLSLRKRTFHLWCDRFLHNMKIAGRREFKSSLYVGLLIHCLKPRGGAAGEDKR